MNLRRPVLAAALAAALAGWPMASAASWFKVGQTDRVTLYMDKNSMQQIGEHQWRAWELQDLKSPDPDGVRSRRYLNEYDCEHKMHRIGRMVSYSGPLLTGEKLHEVEEFGYWRNIPRRGLFALAYVIHCGK
ncbi:surface-adhesin E family protein [Ramlibacter sp. MAHUQ-53]|uniref:surface-adhesin E family protein n=1 Tax=unclassified Ramlibacter TaxID=2617605 RepID=UPI0036260D83